ncbi:MAG: hypothetical protein ABIK28_17520, partial [Planctomycetota bacterium]
RAFINIPRILERIPACDMLSLTGKRLLTACLQCTGSIGMAREISPHAIRTWFSGCIDKDEIERAAPGITRSFSQIAEPLMRFFPSHVLASYEVALPLSTLLDLAGHLLRSATPGLHERVRESMDEFAAAYDFDPHAASLQSLGGATAFAWLPVSDAGPGRWPFPRVVVLARVRDKEKTDRLLSAMAEWITGSMAPFSEGVFGARQVKEDFEGVRLTGMEVDSLLSFPMPSPTFACVDDLLIVSPVRSAVKEMISALLGRTPRLEQTGVCPPQALEHIYWNPPAWAEGFKRGWAFAVSSSSLVFLNTRYLYDVQRELQKMNRMGEVFFRFLEHLDPAEGSTTLDENGRFTFYMEIPVR